MSQTITFRIKTTEKEWLEKQARIEGVSVSNLIKKSLNFYQTGRDEHLDKFTQEIRKRLVKV